MKKEGFAQVFGGISETYIQEAETVRQRRPLLRSKGLWIAACLCLALIGLLPPETDAPGPATGDIQPGGASVEIEELESNDDKQNGESNKEAITIQPGETAQVGTETEDAPTTVIDGDALDAKGLEQIWGGSYLDENGCWVIWLTENTPERQAQVLRERPALSKARTIFRTADFTLAYLTQLLADISGEMQAGKLPFVTSAGVMEQNNRVSVTMTTTEEGAMATVSALDELGSALVFQVTTVMQEEFSVIAVAE